MRRLDLGWALAILALLVLPVASWHEATTLHEVCPEHGETLDVTAPRGDHAPTTEGEPCLSAAEGEHAEHELCPYVPLGQPSSQAPEARLAEVRLPETRHEVARAHHARHASIPLLLLAPKQSPPV
jgi:hypothetical protein